MCGVSNFFWSYSAARARADAQPAVALDDPADRFALRGDVPVAALVADEREAIWCGFQPSRRRTYVLSAVDWSWSANVGCTRMANENCVSWASETRVTDTEHSLAAMSRIASSPSGKVGNR